MVLGWASVYPPSPKVCFVVVDFPLIPRFVASRSLLEIDFYNRYKSIFDRDRWSRVRIDNPDWVSGLWVYFSISSRHATGTRAKYNRLYIPRRNRFFDGVNRAINELIRRWALSAVLPDTFGRGDFPRGRGVYRGSFGRDFYEILRAAAFSGGCVSDESRAYRERATKEFSLRRRTKTLRAGVSLVSSTIFFF